MTERRLGDVATGNVVCTTKGGIDTARDTGSRPYREILIELKD